MRLSMLLIGTSEAVNWKCSRKEGVVVSGTSSGDIAAGNGG
jgi:hypothetical protein